jgi:class 3 adenylate cyclase
LRTLIDRRASDRSIYEYGQRRRWPPLDFADPALEEDFRLRDDAGARRLGLTAVLLAAVLYVAFALLDPLVVPHDAGDLLLPRLIVIAWLLVAAVWLAREPPPRTQRLLVCSAVVVAALALDVMSFLAPLPTTYLVGGTMLVAIALFTLAGVRLADATPTAAIVVAGFLIATAGDDVETTAVAVANVVIVLGGITFGCIAAYMLEDLRRRGYLNDRSLDRERVRSDRLLHSILPQDIAARLRRDPSAIAETHDVTVVFADVVGFTRVTAELPATTVVELLDGLFTQFDALCRRHGVEKIKTIGDAYMAVAGAPLPDAAHADAVAEVALGMLDVAASFTSWPGGLQLRVGVSSGPAVAGVIGQDKFAYDLWGDTVNTASRMESHGTPGGIQISQATRSLLADGYRLGPATETAVKGGAFVTTYALLGRRPGFSRRPRPA